MVDVSFESRYGITIEKVAAHWGALVHNEMMMLLHFLARNSGDDPLLKAMDFSLSKYEETRSSRVSALEGFLNVWNFHNPGAPVPAGMRELMQNGVEAIILDSAQKSVDLLPDEERPQAVSTYGDIAKEVISKADSAVVSWLVDLIKESTGQDRPADRAGFAQWARKVLGLS